MIYVFIAFLFIVYRWPLTAFFAHSGKILACIVARWLACSVKCDLRCSVTGQSVVHSRLLYSLRHSDNPPRLRPALPDRSTGPVRSARSGRRPHSYRYPAPADSGAGQSGLDSARPARGLDLGQAVGALCRLSAAVRRYSPSQDALRARAVCDGDDATVVVLASCIQAAQTALQVLCVCIITTCLYLFIYLFIMMSYSEYTWSKSKKKIKIKINKNKSSTLILIEITTTWKWSLFHGQPNTCT